ncbi:hypothetical protein Dimus_017140 [Dionaea muscipula]
MRRSGMRKCRGMADVTVVGVADLGVRVGGGGGVRTRARALAMAAAAVGGSSENCEATAAAARKMRKVGKGELRHGPDYLELSSRRRVVIGEENVEGNSSNSASCFVDEDANCLSSVSNNNDNTPSASSSCCSSNASSDEQQQKLVVVVVEQDPLAIIIDPEEEDGRSELEKFINSNSNCTKRGETTPSSDSKAEANNLMDSPAMKTTSSEYNSRIRSSTVEKMPSDSEIEDFFAAAEVDLQKSFIDKYNFDIVRDVPLEGRYQWVPVKP